MDPRALGRDLAASASPGMARRLAGAWAAQRAAALVMTAPRLEQRDQAETVLLAGAQAAASNLGEKIDMADPVAAKPSITGASFLAEQLRGRIGAARSRISKATDRVSAAVGEIERAVPKAEAVADALEREAADLTAAAGLTNGGPA